MLTASDEPSIHDRGGEHERGHAAAAAYHEAPEQNELPGPSDQRGE